MWACPSYIFLLPHSSNPSVKIGNIRFTFVFVASKEKHIQEEVSKEVSKIIKHKKVVHKMEKKQSQQESEIFPTPMKKSSALETSNIYAS